MESRGLFGEEGGWGRRVKRRWKVEGGRGWDMSILEIWSRFCGGDCYEEATSGSIT